MANARVNIEGFSGEIPHTSNRLLPPNFARTAKNVNLHSGELRGLRGLEFLKTIAGAVKAYRIPDPLAVGGYTWIGLTSLDETVIRAPLINDTYERFYKFGNGAAEYNTLERIRDEDPWFLLGVPEPSATGTMTATGGSGTLETRYYVYTFVSAYGEEGPPSTPVSDEGYPDASWDYASMDTTVPSASSRNITSKNIYRTVAGYSTAEFFYVGNVALATATYSDTTTNDEASRNAILESEQWFEPSSDIEGVAVMPNGFLVAWAGANVYFSEPYRPHAWPPPYDLSTDAEICGGGVFGQSIGLVTKGAPYIGMGANPAAVVLTKSSTVEPGLSAYGIVTLPYGVLYPSQNGLMLLGPNGPQLSTRQMVTNVEWASYSPSTMKAAEYQSAYVGFYDSDNGIVVDPVDPRMSFVQLDRFTNVSNVQTDPYTGDMFVIKSGDIYKWDATSNPRVSYTWRSKDFSFKKPANLGAVNIEAVNSTDPDIIEEEAESLAAATAWNAARFAAGPLDMIGGAVIGGGITYTLAPPNDMYKVQNQHPLGGSSLIDLAALVASQESITLNVYAGEELKYSQLWMGQDCIRLPSGFKSDIWSFELKGNSVVYSLAAAETCRGLKDV